MVYVRLLATNPDSVESITAEFKKNPLVGYISSCLALRNLDFSVVIAEMSVPRLIIGGEYDKAPPSEILKTVADRVDKSQFIVLLADHLSNVGAVAEFN